MILQLIIMERKRTTTNIVVACCEIGICNLPTADMEHLSSVRALACGLWGLEARALLPAGSNTVHLRHVCVREGRGVTRRRRLAVPGGSRFSGAK